MAIYTYVLCTIYNIITDNVYSVKKVSRIRYIMYNRNVYLFQCNFISLSTNYCVIFIDCGNIPGTITYLVQASSESIITDNALNN